MSEHVCVICVMCVCVCVCVFVCVCINVSEVTFNNVKSLLPKCSEVLKLLR